MSLLPFILCLNRRLLKNPGKVISLLCAILVASMLAYIPVYAAEINIDSVNPPVLVKDIDPTTASSNPTFQVFEDRALITMKGSTGDERWWSDGTPTGTVFLSQEVRPTSTPVKISDTWFFIGLDTQHGYELWRTDGTPAGTSLVKDIYPGPNPENVDPGTDPFLLPSGLTRINNTLFFIANDKVHGRELWRSDGTADGTLLVKDINPGTASSLYIDMTNVGDTLFFNVGVDALWKSDGTAQNTTEVKRFTVTAPGWLSQITPVANHLFFTVGADLWVTDGTTPGTLLLKQFITNTTYCGIGCDFDIIYPQYLTAVGDTLFLQADDGVSGVDLWRSDGTPAGTLLVQDSIPVPGGQWPVPLAVFNQLLIFSSNYSLWISNGTGVGATRLLDDSHYLYGDRFVSTNGSGFFVASPISAAPHGLELWRTDGTPVGTALVKVISSNVGHDPQLTSVNNLLLFVGKLEAQGEELWRSDGTEAGTTLVADIRPGAAGSTPTYLTAFNGKVLFGANDGVHGQEPWVSDGSGANTLLLRDSNTAPSSSNPRLFTPINGTLLFTAHANGVQRLWKSDGSETGTAPVEQITFNMTESQYEVLRVNDMTFIAPQDPGAAYNDAQHSLWRSDDTLTDLLPLRKSGRIDSLIAYNNTLFFQQRNSETNGLWKSDGTVTGTVQVKAMEPLRSLVDVNGLLYFFAGSWLDMQLWKSDGTTDGTQPIQNFISVRSLPALTHLQGTLLFLYLDNDYNLTLGKSDGTATTQLKTIPSMLDFSEPYRQLLFYPLSNRALFIVLSQQNIDQLWSTDGTAQGTILLKEINATLTGPALTMLTTLNEHKLFFSADDGVHGRELWMSDGTVAGTGLVKDIAVGSASANPTGLTEVNDILLFTATDANGQQALWRTNDTGTRVQPVLALGDLRDAADFTVVGGNLLFCAYSPAVGRELWKIPVTAETVLAVTIPPQHLGVSLGTTAIPIQLMNEGLGKATNINLAITLDERLTYVGNSQKAPTTVNGRTVTLSLSDIGFWYQDTLELYVSVPLAEAGTSFPISLVITANAAKSATGQTDLVVAAHSLYLPVVSRR